MFTHIRPAGIIFSWGLQLRLLLEITKFHLHKSVPGAGIIRNAGIIRGRVLYEEIRYAQQCKDRGPKKVTIYFPIFNSVKSSENNLFFTCILPDY